MALQFLEEFASRNGLKLSGFRPEVLEWLQNYDWPGNVRELRNVVERMVALCEGTEVGLKDLNLMHRDPSRIPRAASPSRETVTLYQSREEAEIQRINEALQKHRNNRQRAAAELGISRMGLYKKLHKYGLIQTADSGATWEEAGGDAKAAVP
jgi:DNA-binding NtrC family response regulator